jgi:sodium-dependent dicarboxylate transporter 2/3/5
VEDFFSKSTRKAGLIQQLGSWITNYAGTNLLLLILVVTIISIFISEVMSNVAQVIVFAPVVVSIADAMHINPLMLGIPMTLAASVQVCYQWVHLPMQLYLQVES